MKPKLTRGHCLALVGRPQIEIYEPAAAAFEHGSGPLAQIAAAYALSSADPGVHPSQQPA